MLHSHFHILSCSENMQFVGKRRISPAVLQHMMGFNKVRRKKSIPHKFNQLLYLHTQQWCANMEDMFTRTFDLNCCYLFTHVQKLHTQTKRDVIEVTAVIRGFVFFLLSVLLSLVNAISQEHLWGFSSKFAQISVWTQRSVDDNLVVRGQRSSSL